MNFREMVKSVKGVKFSVGQRGWIMLTDVMGSDSSIANCARTSYGNGTKKVSDDEHLLRYMMRHGHTSPFEQAELQFLVYVPMDIWRQWVRHRTANINEYSTRYSEAINEMQVADVWRKQSTGNKQGSEGEITGADAAELSSSEEELQRLCREVYEHRLAKGVAREQARKDLPLSTFTKAYWKIDLHNLLHFLELRLDKHAQKEIREYAGAISFVVSKLFPITWKAFKDYRLNAMSLSATEIELLPYMVVKYIIRAMEVFSGEDYSEENARADSVFDETVPADWVGSREQKEFFKKVKRLLPIDFAIKEEEQNGNQNLGWASDKL